MTVPCRQCDDCKEKRRAIWTARAAAETRLAKRTWLCTLTLRPEEQYRASVMAQKRAAERGHTWSDLTDDQRAGHVLGVMSRELTLYFKRVRKAATAKLRYLTVSEHHKSGLPHFHVLIHECEGVVRYADLDTWRLGFARFKLVADHDTRAAIYACKYLTKATRSRVRASLDYGSPTTAAFRRSGRETKRELRPPKNASLLGNRGESDGISSSVSTERAGEETGPEALNRGTAVAGTATETGAQCSHTTASDAGATNQTASKSEAGKAS